MYNRGDYKGAAVCVRNGSISANNQNIYKQVMKLRLLMSCAALERRPYLKLYIHIACVV